MIVVKGAVVLVLELPVRLIPDFFALSQTFVFAVCCTCTGPVLSVFAQREKSYLCMQSRFDEGLSWTRVRAAVKTILGSSVSVFVLRVWVRHQAIKASSYIIRKWKWVCHEIMLRFCQLQWKLRGVCWYFLQPPRWRRICPAALCSLVAVIMVVLAAVTDLIILFL